ncbi:c-type cytochrome [Thiomicrorhabdus sp.]|uniref:c-type cytochrome n=1 Tax=Thiomicrorhabdus sp. TaxID=2039724 RepID=UPI002AA64364|nr:c-type cytochrome [Thiomicrorhabdus sp.]
MKKRFNFKTTAFLSTALLSSALLLGGCSGDNDDATQAQAPAEQQNTMAVKQPEPTAAPKEALQAEPAASNEETVAKVEENLDAIKEQVVTDKVEDAKEEVAAVVAAAPSGEKLYATCVGCHGAKAEGGVGPRLNNQKPEDIVAKLKKYKSGEQMGPMTAMMAPMASGLSDDDMKAIADYVTTL